MTALDFIMYCTGTGIVMVSAGLTVRLAAGTVRRTRKLEAQATTGPIWQPVPDPTNEGMVHRLQDFQTTRYSSPIVRRALSDDAGPQRPRPAPTPPPAPPRLRQAVQKPAPRVENEKVVPFPQRMQRDVDPNKKED